MKQLLKFQKIECQILFTYFKSIKNISLFLHIKNSFSLTLYHCLDTELLLRIIAAQYLLHNFSKLSKSILLILSVQSFACAFNFDIMALTSKTRSVLLIYFISCFYSNPTTNGVRFDFYYSFQSLVFNYFYPLVILFQIMDFLFKFSVIIFPLFNVTYKSLVFFGQIFILFDEFCFSYFIEIQYVSITTPFKTAYKIFSELFDEVYRFLLVELLYNKFFFMEQTLENIFHKKVSQNFFVKLFQYFIESFKINFLQKISKIMKVNLKYSAIYFRIKVRQEKCLYKREGNFKNYQLALVVLLPFLKPEGSCIFYDFILFFFVQFLTLKLICPFSIFRYLKILYGFYYDYRSCKAEYYYSGINKKILYAHSMQLNGLRLIYYNIYSEFNIIYFRIQYHLFQNDP